MDITFHLYSGWPNEHLPKMIKKNNIGAVICDFFPLRLPMKWQDDVKKELPDDVPLIQVSLELILFNFCYELNYF